MVQSRITDVKEIKCSGTIMPASLVSLCRPPSTLTDVNEFLRSQDHSAYNMLPDGNYMFRVLCHQLFGTIEHHLELRQILLSVI